MTMQADLSQDGRVLTVSLPFSIRRRGGRKRVVAPEGAPSWVPRPGRIDSTVVKAIARAYRWQAMLEDGSYGPIAELAAAERINPSYLARVLRMTLLAPEIVENILGGRSGEGITLEWLMRPFAVEWDRQRF
jgi:hypothetical protein